MIKEYNSYPQISVDNFIYKMKKEEFIQDPFLKLLTYEEENIVKGILLYSEIYDRIEINQIEVIPIYQNRHIASSLMQYLIDQAKNKKIIKVSINQLTRKKDLFIMAMPSFSLPNRMRRVPFKIVRFQPKM